jgi:two-component sensor histidine kinase
MPGVRGAYIRKILHSRLPQRWAHRAPPALVELSIGLAVALVLIALRMPFAGLAGDRAPYALNFLAVVLAAVLAGWRSGLVALLVGQWLTWYLIVPPYYSIAVADSQRLAGLIIASISQLLVLLVIALYQREVDKGTAERERRMELLHHALREIDHRTSNNYQTVLSLIHMQAQRSREGNLRDALLQISDRIGAIAKASEQMALRSATLEQVRLDDHLCELCNHIERGLSRDEIDVDCKVSECSAEPDRAIAISIIVNELVTNALKHAFVAREAGRVQVIGRTDEVGLELTIADNGNGMKPPKSGIRGGLGTKLVETYVRQLSARHEVISSDSGTTHRLVIPNLN